jgi:pimeloyl-ACP methyl ester carboxylesterase
MSIKTDSPNMKEEQFGLLPTTVLNLENRSSARHHSNHQDKNQPLEQKHTKDLAHLAGSVPILFVNGGWHLFPFTEQFMNTYSVRLHPTFDLFTFSRRAWGKDAVGPFTIDSFVDDADSVLDARKVERVIVMGISWGAVLALAYAVKRSSRLLGIILIDPYLLAHPHWVDAFAKRLMKKLPRIKRSKIVDILSVEPTSESEILQRDSDIIVEVLTVFPAPEWWGDSFRHTQLLFDYTTLNASSTDPPTLEVLDIRSLSLTPIFQKDLLSVDTPVIVLQGDREALPLLSVAEIRRLLHGCHDMVAVYERGRSYDYIFRSSPEVFSSSIRDWWDRVGARRKSQFTG